MPEALARTYARFIANLDYAQLPARTVDKLKASLLHAMFVSLVGSQTAHGKAAIELVKEEEANPHGATVLADGARASRCGAAFANSKLMHATNQTDSYRMLIHPGPCIIPAALATAELSGASGAELLTAMAAGYEVEARIAGDFIPATQARGFRCSPVYGTLGAAVTTAKLLGLDEDQTVTALALACTFAGGTTEGPRVSGREMLYHEPNATRSGIMAALLAREDVRGSEEALEGPAGFYNAFTGNNRGELSYVFTGLQQVSFEPVTEGLGTRWELLHTALKMYPTAGYNCPVIDLMTDIQRAHQLAIAEIERITIDMNWLETLYPSPAFPNPSRGQAIAGSTHYFTAYVAVNGSYPPLRTRIDPGDDSDAVTADNHDAVLALMHKVQTVGHKDRPAFAPRITIDMAGGNVYRGEYQGNELEWGLDTEVERLRPLFRQINWPADKLEATVAAVRDVHSAADINDLIAAATP
jgi:2-methylcitrate dehydratase PrpD